MKSLEPGVLERQRLPPSLVRAARLLGEYAGQPSAGRASPRLLDQLRQDALVRGVESSNRLEGVVLAPDRLRDIVIRRAGVENRAEQEVLGYCGALDRVVRATAADPFTPQIVLQVHADLYRFVPEGGGCWKVSDDLVTETLADGSTAVIFTPVPAYGVEDAMNRLHDGFAHQWDAGAIDPLLLIPAYLLDFLCIHPFSDGNDRMLHLLALLLLRRAGYHVASFVSLVPLFERRKADCSAALQASWRGWHTATHDLGPWSEFFAGVLLEACQQFEDCVETASPPRGAQRERVADAVKRLPRDFRYADLERLVPSVSRPTINRALRRLRAERVVRCVKRGRSARWQRA